MNEYYILYCFLCQPLRQFRSIGADLPESFASLEDLHNITSLET